MIKKSEINTINGDVLRFKAGSFKSQCMNYKFGEQIWAMVNEVFDCMPLAAVVDNSIFCTHGGIPRIISSGINLDILLKIENIQRPLLSSQIEHDLLALDLLWSDPASDEDLIDSSGFGTSKRGDGIVGKKNFFSFLK